MKIWLASLSTMLLVLLSVVQVAAQGSPSSPQWINLWSVNSELQVGDVVSVYDSNGVLCGQTFVHTESSYGFLACALDDPNTPTDEGTAPGDTLSFTINNVRIGTTFGVPGSIYNGQMFQVDLTTGLVITAPGKPESCIDGYEPNEDRDMASSLTGPQAHTFFSEKKGWDQDWAKFDAKANWTYQIQARSQQPSALTHPILYLYDKDGNLLAENRMDKWGRGAEIWWWNGSGDQELFVLVEEDEGKYGCRHYTLTLQPFSADEMRARFGQ